MTLPLNRKVAKILWNVTEVTFEGFHQDLSLDVERINLGRVQLLVVVRPQAKAAEFRGLLGHVPADLDLGLTASLFIQRGLDGDPGKPMVGGLLLGSELDAVVLEKLWRTPELGAAIDSLTKALDAGQWDVQAGEEKGV